MSLQAIARVYIQKIRPKAQAEIDWFQQQPTLNSAIELAALARNSRGQRYSHQRRLKKAHLELAKQALLTNARSIARALGFDGKTKALDKSILPRAFQLLEAHEIEDVLCIFKEDLKTGQEKLPEKKIAQRSWCR